MYIILLTIKVKTVIVVRVIFILKSPPDVSAALFTVEDESYNKYWERKIDN
jgi:hypothetical protein